MESWNNGILESAFLSNSIIPLFHYSIAQRSYKKYSTPSHEAGTKYTKKKNYNYLNLPLCSLWFLGAFVFEDFFAKKTKI